MAAATMTGIAACGGDKTTPDDGNAPLPAFKDERDGLVKPEPEADTVNRGPRPGAIAYNAPPPPIAADVQAAAQAAGCDVRGFKSETQPQSHIPGESATRESAPPLSGGHNQKWADYGVYNEPIPYKYQLHNLEHGAVFVQYGTKVSVEGVNALREMWAKSPAYLVISPNSGAAFPAEGVVVGAQQRWMVCKPTFTAAMIPAVEAFRDAYRGRGPEGSPALNSDQPRPDDLPEPVLADTGAKGQ